VSGLEGSTNLHSLEGAKMIAPCVSFYTNNPKYNSSKLNTFDSKENDPLMQTQEQYCHFIGGVAEISVHLEIWFSTQSDCVHDSFINSENPYPTKARNFGFISLSDRRIQW
jgi:hypothetical protein